MQYLKTSSKRGYTTQPAPDFNCGWSALHLLNSWSLLASASGKAVPTAERDDKPSSRDVREAAFSGHAQQPYS